LCSCPANFQISLLACKRKGEKVANLGADDCLQKSPCLWTQYILADVALPLTTPPPKKKKKIPLMTCNACRRSPISIAAAVIYIITQLSDDKKPLRGLMIVSNSFYQVETNGSVVDETRYFRKNPTLSVLVRQAVQYSRF
jgi:hypothetical protein